MTFIQGCCDTALRWGEPVTEAQLRALKNELTSFKKSIIQIPKRICRKKPLKAKALMQVNERISWDIEISEKILSKINRSGSNN